MIKKHSTLFYIIALLILIQVLHLLVLLCLSYLDILSYDQEGVVLLISFQLISLSAILFIAKWFAIDIRIKWTKCDSRIVGNALVLLLFLYILQIALEKTFVDSLLQGQLRFLKLDFNIPEDFYSKTSIFISIFMAPILEEILYRRIIFNKLLEEYKVPISIIITSFLFAFFHLNVEGFVAYFFVGLVLTYLYHLTKILWLNILFHSLFNVLVNFTKIETYQSTDSFYFIGLLIYGISALGIFITLKEIKSLTK